MDDFVLADSTRPDFSLPPLEKADLSMPGLTLLNPQQPDPYLPDLTAPQIPDDLDRPDVLLPDPFSPDLLQPALPETLTLSDAQTPEYPELTGPVDVQIPLAEEPATLAPSALSLAGNSADAQNLPPHLRYDQVYTAQDEMTHRARHLAPLLLALEGQVQQ